MPQKSVGHIQQKESENELLIFKLRNRAAHFLGIKDPTTSFDAQTNAAVSIDANVEKSKIRSQGMELSDAQSSFMHLLSQYKSSDSFETEFNAIKNAFANINYDLPFVQQVDNNYAYYDNHHFVIIPTGWLEHSVSIAATDKFLIVANRGEGMHPKGGCIIYPLKKPLTKEDVAIFTECLGDRRTIENQIKSIVQLDANNDPVIFQALPLKAQKYPTCSIANRKALVAGVLLLLSAQRDNESDPKIDDFLIATCNKEYKRFTHYTRLLTLEELMNELTKTVNHKQAIMEDLVDYCNQHLDLNNESETILLYQLIKNISSDLKKDFLNQLNIEAKIEEQKLKAITFSDGAESIPTRSVRELIARHEAKIEEQKPKPRK